MVSINKVISSPIAKIQPHKVQKAAKMAAPVAGGLAVLAGSGMSNPDDLSFINAEPLPLGADVYNDPLLDQISYRASELSDTAANLMEGASDIAGGALHIAKTVGGAAIDTFEFAEDVALAGVTKVIETIVDIVT